LTTTRTYLLGNNTVQRATIDDISARRARGLLPPLPRERRLSLEGQRPSLIEEPPRTDDDGAARSSTTDKEKKKRGRTPTNPGCVQSYVREAGAEPSGTREREGNTPKRRAKGRRRRRRGGGSRTRPRRRWIRCVPVVVGGWRPAPRRQGHSTFGRPGLPHQQRPPRRHHLSSTGASSAPASPRRARGRRRARCRSCASPA